MRRVITVNLDGNAFQVEEEAYERLRAYLTLAESRLGADPGRKEIMADLERGIGGHISNRESAASVPVSDASMQHILETVGAVERDAGSTPAPGAEPPSAGLRNVMSENSFVPAGSSEYGRLPVLLLCVLLGWLGVHRFFVGKIGTGVLQLLTFGGLGLWALYDLILVVCGEFRDSEGRKVLRWN